MPWRCAWETTTRCARPPFENAGLRSRGLLSVGAARVTRHARHIAIPLELHAIVEPGQQQHDPIFEVGERHAAVELAEERVRERAMIARRHVIEAMDERLQQ